MTLAAIIVSLFCISVFGQSRALDHPRHRFLLDSSVTDATNSSGVVLTYNVTSLSFTNGQWITVSWSGVQSPAALDYIALYPTAFEANVTVSKLINNAPIKYIFANVSAGYNTSGAGKHSFYLQNVRTTVQFLFLTGGPTKPVIVAKGPVLTPANLNEPTQVHLALTGVNSEMAVMWVSLNTSTPLVKWGTQSGTYTSTAPSNPKTYVITDLCTGYGASIATTTGWYPPGQNHYAVMTGLQPLTRYYYIVGDEAYGYSAEFSFLSAPPVGPQVSVDIVIMADLGEGQADQTNESGRYEEPSVNTTELIAAETQAQLVLLNGDLAYADGYLLDWDYFGDQMQAIAASKPLMTIGGNHEYTWPTLTYNGSGNNGYLGTVNDTDSKGECGVPYSQKWVMPSGAPWYSYNFGPIHFLGMSTEHTFAPGTPQYKFIQSDLAAVDRTITPWLIVNTHRSTYIDQTSPDTVVSPLLISYLAPLFQTYKVDLVFSGHTHLYETTCPIANSTCAPPGGGPTYIVTGSAGRLVNPSGSTVALSFYNSSVPLPAASKIFHKVQISYGYMRATVNGTTFTAEAVGSAQLGSGYQPLKSAGDDLVSDPFTEPNSAPKNNGYNFGLDPGYGQIFDLFNVTTRAIAPSS